VIGILVGMRSEARLLPGRLVLCSGGRPERARALAQRMLDEGAEGLLSFGIAGGLDPRLTPGNLVIGSAVAAGGRRLEADAAWCRRLAAALPGACSGIIAGSDEVVASAAAKAELAARCGAVAVDMESGAVAEACARAGKPFAVLRAIADPAGRGIPALAMRGLGPDGETRPLAVAAGLLRHPGDLPALIRLGRDSQAALAALAAVGSVL